MGRTVVAHRRLLLILLVILMLPCCGKKGPPRIAGETGAGVIEVTASQQDGLVTLEWTWTGPADRIESFAAGRGVFSAGEKPCRACPEYFQVLAEYRLSPEEKQRRSLSFVAVDPQPEPGRIHEYRVWPVTQAGKSEDGATSVFLRVR